MNARPLDPKQEWHVLNTHGRILAAKSSKENLAARRGMAARQRQIIAEQKAKAEKAKQAKKNGKKK